MIKSKRGSHVGFVLSFVIFVIAIVYIYSILKPAITTPSRETITFKNLEQSLMDVSYEEVTTFTVQLEGINPNKDCVKIQNILEEIIISDLIIKDGQENLRAYEISGQGLLVDVGLNFEGVLKFYYSDNLGNTSVAGGTMGGCEPLTGYSIEIIASDKYNYAESIIDILDRYQTDYEALKIELGVASDKDFDFAFIYNNGSKIGTGTEITTSEDIYVKTTPIKYIDADANINMGYLEISVW